MTQRDESWRELHQLASAAHGVFSSAQARELGVTSRRLRAAANRGDLVDLGARVFAVSGTPPTTHQRLAAATLSVPGSALAGRSAAWLHRLGDTRVAPPTELWIPESARHSMAGVTFHRMSTVEPHRHVLDVDGIPVLSAATTMCHLGIVAEQRLLLHCLDDFERRFPMQWLRQTMSELRSRGRNGVPALERALADPRRVAGVTESWLERIIADAANVPGMPEIRLQHEVRVGGRTFRLDIAVPVVLLGVEGTSREYHFGSIKKDEDNVRDLSLASVGWELLYVTWSMANDPASFVDLLVKTVMTRARQLRIPLAA